MFPLSLRLLRPGIALIAVSAVSLLAAAPAAAQAVASNPTPLEFVGVRPGARLQQAAARGRALDGGTLRCERARSERRVTECRGAVVDPHLGGHQDLRLPAIASVAAVPALSGHVAPGHLHLCRSSL